MHNSDKGEKTPHEKPNTAHSAFASALPWDTNNKSAIEYYAG